MVGLLSAPVSGTSIEAGHFILSIQGEATDFRSGRDCASYDEVDKPFATYQDKSGESPD
jgi:arabinogalactan endo-1,4-beta-galactosidase